MSDSTDSKIRLDIGARLVEGRKIARVNYKAEDAAKLGVLRAGNSGIMNAEGEVAGSCHRVAHLRQIGIELDPPSDSTQIMFQLGVASETLIYDDLVRTSAPNEIVLRETEVPIAWMTSNGTKVTGRPDMVICEQTLALDAEAQYDRESGIKYFLDSDYIRKPLLVLELKSVASVWTSRSVLFEGKPKLGNLAQIGHYMWKLGVPGRLIYKQYALQAMPDFAHKLFPAKGERGSEHIDYNPQGKPKAIRPFEVVYALEFGPTGSLRYRRENNPTGEWTETIVTTADIEKYYEYISKMATDNVLGPRPLTLDAEGTKLSFSICSYCPLDKLCKEEKIYDRWIERVKTIVSGRE
jgi:hypothetical protein